MNESERARPSYGLMLMASQKADVQGAQGSIYSAVVPFVDIFSRVFHGKSDLGFQTNGFIAKTETKGLQEVE